MSGAEVGQRQVELTRADVESRIAGLPEDTQKSVVCALIGHSRIQSTFFGYFYCGRCEAQVGDSIGSIYSASSAVIIGHDCEVCLANFATLTWRDTFMAPDPFAKDDAETARLAKVQP